MSSNISDQTVHIHSSQPSQGYVHSGYYASLQMNTKPSTTTISPITKPAPVRSFRNGPGGPVRCSNPGCPYSGYEKDVELHMMDRHLIFPPGYKPPKGPPDGEVGPNMTIPGTGILLNTPEAIEAWIQERKRNWPTAGRVHEMEKRKAEAIERGELDSSHKRKRLNTVNKREFGSSRGGRGRGRGNTGLTRSLNRKVARGGSTRQISTPKPPSEEDDANEDASGSDIDHIRDAISSKKPTNRLKDNFSGDESSTTGDEEDITSKPVLVKPLKRPRQKQPSQRPHNPLIDRPSFLRRLLLPEIKHTISNLSQAIRFIVDNDMLEGVELRPGEAENQLIQELDSHTSPS